MKTLQALLSGATLLALFACTAPHAFAQAGAPLPTASATPAKTETDAKNARPLPFKSVVVSVDPVGRSFQMGKKKIRVVHVVPATRLTLSSGAPASFGDLRPGMEVRGSTRKLPSGELEAVSVKIGPKEAAPKSKDQ